MPKRTDIRKVMVIGSGPIVIGQAAEFDYAGTQACLALKEEGYEVVLASPYAYGGGFSNTAWHRVFLSHAANGLTKVVLGIHGIQTFSCFFRLYNTAILRRLAARYGDGIIELAGFECMLELLCKMINVSATISEVPLHVDTSVRAGKSKLKIVRTIMGYFRVFLRARRWRPLAHRALSTAL